jgi:hypothetical protein
MSCASSGHINKVKQSILRLRYLWVHMCSSSTSRDVKAVIKNIIMRFGLFGIGSFIKFFFSKMFAFFRQILLNVSNIS